MSVSTIGVIGAGVMGSGIAQVAATKNINVILLDANEKTVKTGIDVVENRLSRVVSKGKNRITIRGSIVGSREDLAEAIAFAAEGKVRTEIHRTRLDNINLVFSDLKAGKIDGRAVLMM
jgi:D-arabinose 1-dehydrogenase-like Zn-dependent alcohol dehydrogenase